MAASRLLAGALFNVLIFQLGQLWRVGRNSDNNVGAKHRAALNTHSVRIDFFFCCVSIGTVVGAAIDDEGLDQDGGSIE